MLRNALPAAATLAILTGCSTYDPYYSSTPTPHQPVITAVPTIAPAVPASSGAVPSPVTYRTGTGTVESVSVVRVAPPSASTGASGPDRAAYRLSVRMDDGTVQSIDQDNRAFMVGDRVDIASTGQIVRR